MKIKEGYLLKKVADCHIVVPVGDLNFEGLINLNETGAFLWNKIEEGCSQGELVDALLGEYEIDKDTASKDIEAFLEILRRENIIDE